MNETIDDKNQLSRTNEQSCGLIWFTDMATPV